MYKIKRFSTATQKEFGLTRSNRIKVWENKNSKYEPPKDSEIDSSIGSNKSYKWKGVELYEVITNHSNKRFSKNYEYLRKQSNHQEYERLLLQRLDQLLNDLKGLNKDKIQYVTKDNPHTKPEDETHSLLNISSKDVIVMSKSIDSEHRLVYEVHRPKLTNGKMTSKVIIDDINDHTYKGIVYQGIKGRTTTNKDTGETIVEDKPDFKGRHKTRKYNDDESIY